MDLYRYANNPTRGAYHYVREVAGGMLVALCGRNADGMAPLAAATRHTECRRCANARAHHALMNEVAADRAPVEPAAEVEVEAPSGPALYRPAGTRRRSAGHYRRPGTTSSYCGRTVEAAPVDAQSVTGVCQPCAKAEQRDRVEAEQVAADRSVDGPTLAERAGVRYALVGTGRRVHYSGNDDTLCGREVSRYTDGTDKGHPELCAPCVRAAEERAYARALAADSPLAAAAVDLAETVEQADAEREQHLDTVEAVAAEQFEQAAHIADAVEHAEQVEAGVATVGEAVALYDAHLAADALVDDELRHAAALVTEAEATDGTWRGEWIGDTPADATLFVVDRTVEQGALFDGRATATAPEPVVVRVSFDDDTLARIKAKADADRAAYRAETDDRIAAEHRTYGAPVPAAVQARIDARTSEQAAPVAEPVDFRDIAEGDVVTFLTANNGYGGDGHPFMRTGTVRTKTDDTVVVDCTSNRLGATARLTRRAWAERSVCRIEQAPARRVLEGKIVTHNGTTKGSAPKHSTDPDTRAALDALAALRLAEVTDHTDVAAQPGDLDHTPNAWGFLVEPRGHGRVALYWIEAGRYVRPDGEPFAVELEIGAERLRKAGWKVENGTRRCVMAWRPE